MDPRRTPVRRAGLAVLAATLVLAGAGCSDDGGSRSLGAPPAAVVDGTAITQDDVLRLAEATNRYDEFLVDSGQDQGTSQGRIDAFAGTGTDTVGMDAVEAALGQLIEAEVLRQELERLDALPTDEDRDALRSSLEQQLTEEDRESIGSDMIELSIETRALVQAYQEHLAAEEAAAAEPIDPEEREVQLRELYETVAPSLPLCLNVMLLGNEADAAEARSRVEGGEDFAAVAAEVSLDPQSADAGGFAGCTAYEDTADTIGVDFEGMAVGEFADPVEIPSQTGGASQYAIFQVAGTDGPTYEQLLPQLEAQIPAEPEVPEASQIDYRAPLAEVYADADIRVDPRFGSWNDETNAIDPPSSPAPAIERDLLTTEG